MKKLNVLGISHLIVPVIVFVMLGAIGGVYLLSQSKAATPSLTIGSKVHICLSSKPNECLVTTGVGKSIFVKTTGWALWTVKSGGVAANQFQDKSGNCLYSPTANILSVARGACSSGKSNETWLKNTSNPYQFQNKWNGNLLAASGKTSGSYVQATFPNRTGYNYKWVIEN